MDGDKDFLWARSMKTALILKQYWTIVPRDEVMNVGVPEEARLAYLHCAQNSVSAITMASSDHFLGSSFYSDHSSKLWSELEVRYSVSTEATIKAF